jgi:hypothetical protein
MNTDTGELKEFANGEIPEGNWVEWKLHEIVNCKGCMFEVVGIKIAEQTIKLRCMSGRIR